MRAHPAGPLHGNITPPTAAGTLQPRSSIILGIAEDPSKAAIVRAALDLGHNLRLEVVAEGVEDQRTWDLLFALGCDTAQGYYMSRPMPAEAVLPWLLNSPYGSAARAGQAA